MNVLIEPEAEAEIEAAALWYQTEAPGLGNEFTRAVLAAVAVLGRNPYAFAVVYGSVRRIHLRRFPFSLFYEIDTDQVAVTACLHQHRDPETWPQH
jgi:plasmid stabilization system protein ParE